MPEPQALVIFVAAAVALLVIPGPAVLYVVAQSLDQGRKAGLVSTLGIGVGTLFHVAAASLGLSALLVASAAAYTAVKLLGAAYLIYLGIQRLRSPVEWKSSRGTRSPDLGRAFRQGIVVNALNPKTAAFFFAFLPQFVDPARGSVALQTFLLGSLFVAMGVTSDSVYALVAGGLGDWLRQRPVFLRLQHWISGGTYLVLGVAAAVTGSRR